MKIIKEIINYLETELPRTEGKYNKSQEKIVEFIGREDLININFTYLLTSGKLQISVKDLTDNIDKIVGSKQLYDNSYRFNAGEGIVFNRQYRYNNINDRVTRPSMRTLLGLE